MKKTLLFALTALLVVGCTHKTMLIDTPAAMEQTEDVSNNTLIIFYDSEIGDKPVKATVAQLKCEIIYEYATMNGLAIRLPGGLAIDKAMKSLKATRGVLQVSRDRINHLD